MHKYWKEYGGKGSYYLIVSEKQVIEFNIETGVDMWSDKRAFVMAHAQRQTTNIDYVKVSEQDFDHYFDSVISKLIEAKSK